jgi:hypothetical protein
MISDIIANQQRIIEIESLGTLTLNEESNNTNNTANTTDTTNTNNNGDITLTKYTHEKIYNYLVDELKTYKQLTVEKDNEISALNTKINNLIECLNELETKLNKMNNINVLIKLKENLTNKQNNFSSEISNINGDEHNDNNNDNNDNTGIPSPTTCELLVDEKKTNTLIDNSSEKSVANPKKRPNMFGRRF